MSDERRPREHFTDEEHAFLRFVRFGELPDRVPPKNRVELVETEARRDLPDHISMDEWVLRLSSGY
jgi:hypothetical protein